MSEVVTSYYLRLRVADQAGVLAKVTGILAGPASASTPCCSARPMKWAARVPPQTDLIILTHDCPRGTMNAAMAQMQACPPCWRPSPASARKRTEPQGRAPGTSLRLKAAGAGFTCHHPRTTSPPAAIRAANISAKSCSKAWRPTAACTCPSTTRKVDDATLAAGARSTTTQGYAELAFEILSLYIDDIPAPI
jgi:hypothetical protein